MVWVEKYRPKKIADLIVSDSILDQISKWIDLWKEGTPVKKARILYGPPGVGKTTTVHVIANELGWPVVEMNASDLRNRDSMKRIALMASIYGDLTTIGENRSGPNKIVLIDEADNIFEGRSRQSGGDTGGISELAKIIKSTRNPIVLTMNEYYEFRRKSSASEIINEALNIEFLQYKRRNDTDYKQFRMKLLARINQILREEGIKIGQSQIMDIVERNENDIRGILNDIESIRDYGQGGASSQADVGYRDSAQNIYKAISTTFKSQDYNKVLRTLYDKDFTTEDYMMWIDQNLPDEAQEPKDLMDAYEVLSRADRLVGRVFKKQHYAFKMYAEEMSAGVSVMIKEKNEHYVKYKFPEIIKSMSRMREARRSREQLLMKLSVAAHTSKRKTRDYFWFYSYLATRDKKFLEGIEKMLQLSDKEVARLKKSGK